MAALRGSLRARRATDGERVEVTQDPTLCPFVHPVEQAYVRGLSSLSDEDRRLSYAGGNGWSADVCAAHRSRSKAMMARKLSRTGPVVSAPSVLGCMGMSDFYGPADRSGKHRHHPRRARRRHHACSTPATSTAWATTRLLIGEALRGRAARRCADQRQVRRLRDPAGAWSGYDCASGGGEELPRLHAAAAGRRLHRHLPAGAPRSATCRSRTRWGAIADMVKAGYVRHIGLSEVGAETIRRAARGASDQRSADRVLADLARHRGRDSADLPRARHRHHRLRRALARPDQRPLVEGSARAKLVFAAMSPALPGRQSRPPTWRSVDTAASALPTSIGALRRAGGDCLGGSAGRPTSCRWSAHGGGTGCPRPWVRSNSQPVLGHTRRVGARCATRRGGGRAPSRRAARLHGQREGAGHTRSPV